METLTLKGLHFHAPHGYYEEERRQGNEFEVDLVISAPLRKAGQTDHLRDTLDYQALQEEVASVMQGPSVKLIETLAYQIGQSVFKGHSEIESLEVTIRKLNPPLDIKTDYSEISMSWQRP